MLSYLLGIIHAEGELASQLSQHRRTISSIQLQHNASSIHGLDAFVLFGASRAAGMVEISSPVRATNNVSIDTAASAVGVG